MTKEKFIQSIKKHKMIEKGDTIVVAVSGGPDSIAMMHLLLSIKEQFQLKLYGVHLDHMTRGGQSTLDAEFVKRFFNDYGIEGYFFKKDIKAYADQLNISFEEAGRLERYRLLNQVMEKTNGNKIALGQNLNDQGETLLFRLFRGTGLDGLTGIDYKREGYIIRPILDLTRKEIERYCEKEDLKTRLDHTNLERIYSRNKIRLDIIPYIKEHFNNKIEKALWRTAKLLTEDQMLIDQVVKNYMDNQVSFKDMKYTINIKSFNKEMNALKSRVIREIFYRINGNIEGLSYKNIKSILSLIEKGKTGKMKELHEIKCFINYNEVEFCKAQQINHDKNDEKLVLKVINNPEIIKFTVNPLEIFIDYDKIQGEIFIRHRKPGDRFRPLGMKGSKKIKDYFIDEKIALDERDEIPLVCDEKNIIWVVGYRMSDAYKITNKTQKVLHIKYV
jgi:tRNA(Ile)-lysidine synthase